MADALTSSYDLSTNNREDLSDIIANVAPAETPVLSAIKRTKATNTLHEWLTDTLDTAAANHNIEGADIDAVQATARTRLSNYTSILDKTVKVSGTQEDGSNPAGIAKEMAYQLVVKGKSIKRDMEYMILNENAKAVGNESTAREMGSLETYIVNNAYNNASAGGSAPTGNGADTATDGTPAALDEDAFKAALQTVWTNSGESDNIMGVCNVFQRNIINAFTGSNTRYVSVKDKNLTASIDVYDGPYSTVKIVADRHCQADRVFLIAPEYLKLAEMRKLHTQDLAKTGDSTKKALIWEATLEVCNPDAHGMIYSLTTS